MTIGENMKERGYLVPKTKIDRLGDNEIYFNISKNFIERVRDLVIPDTYNPFILFIYRNAGISSINCIFMVLDGDQYHLLPTFIWL
jgi:hypothetical protein